MGGVYIKVGLIVAAASALFPVVAKIASTLVYASKETRSALLVGGVGLLTAVFGLVLRSMGESRVAQQK
jgi:hypothetical protein